MSEKNQRHWLDLRHGHVETSDESDPRTRANYYEARPERYQEVQVAPLDAIVIDRADLPEVEPRGDGDPERFTIDGEPYWRHANIDSPDEIDRDVRRRLAWALFLREHPPEDPQVVEMKRDLAAHGPLPGGLAEFLVEAGWRKGAK